MEIIIGLTSLLGVSIAAAIVQTVRINKVKIGKVKSRNDY